MNKPDLNHLSSEANMLFIAFYDSCQREGFKDHFAYWKHLENGGDSNASLDRLDKLHTEALHAYYSARDGEQGFLGSRTA